MNILDKKDIKYIEVVYTASSGKKTTKITLADMITREEAMSILDLIRPNRDVFMANGWTINNTFI